MAEIIKMAGTVRSVNNEGPDDSGNVAVTIPSILQAYPIGSIYMSVNDTDPGELFGGTWEKLRAGRVLVCSGETASSDSFSFNRLPGTYGGLYNYQLDKDNLPAHNHTVTISTKTQSHKHLNGIFDDQAAGSGPISTNYGASTLSPTSSQKVVAADGETFSSSSSLYMGYTSSESTSHNHTATCEETGSGKAFSLMQPYFVVNMWKRTA